MIVYFYWNGLILKFFTKEVLVFCFIGNIVKEGGLYFVNFQMTGV
jgi:hypothetical protein